MKKTPTPKNVDVNDVTATVRTALSKQEKKVQENTTVTKPATKTEKPPKGTPELKTSKSDNTGNTYTYILTSPEQKKAIDLLKFKTKLEKIMTDFFGERLIGVTFTKESYTLTLKDSYEVGDKRRLGRLISDNSGLKQFVRTISYNNEKDTSGQLFKLQSREK